MAERPAYQQILDKIKLEVGDAAYRTSIILGEEDEFWDKAVAVGELVEKRSYYGDTNVFYGMTTNDINSILEAVKPVTRKIKWPLKPYMPKENEKPKFKTRPLIPIFHGVYDIKARKITSPLIIRNPNPPYGYVRIDAEIVEDKERITSQLPGEYIKLMYGLKAVPTETSSYYFALMKVHELVPEVVEVPEQKITKATQIKRLANKEKS